MSDNAEVVREAYGYFEQGDIPSLLELMSDDVEWNVPRIVPQGGSFSGRDGVGGFFAGLAEKWSELGIETEDLIADGDRVIGLGVARGSLAAGGNVEYGYCHAFTVRDGKIVAFREYVALDDKLG
jgi:ketosteroid isomerase-like protein